MVKLDIETYSNWSRLDDGTMEDIGGMAVQGIFFDETPNNYDPILAKCLASFHTAVKESSGLSEGFVGEYEFFLHLFRLTFSNFCKSVPPFFLKKKQPFSLESRKELVMQV